MTYNQAYVDACEVEIAQLKERIAQLTAERDAARRENECLIDEGLLLLNRIAELEAERDAALRECEQLKQAIESWKKDETIWKETEKAYILQAQQMQAGAEELIEENAALKAPVSDEEQEEYSNHTYVYGFRDAV